jgi:hypothetical protein
MKARLLVASVIALLLVRALPVRAQTVGPPGGSGGSGAGGGSVTSITTSTGLTGGTITTSGVIGLATPVAIANGGLGNTLAPSAGQIAVAQSSTLIQPVTLSGDATLSSAGALIVSSVNGVTPGALFPLNVGSGLAASLGNLNLALSGGGCTAGQFVQAINASGAATCATPGGGTGFPGGSPPQLAGFSALNTSEAETLSGDATLSRAGSNSYAIAVSKTNGSAFTALATASIPLSIANGGRGASTAPTAGQLEVAQSASAFAPVTLSGDCSITSAGVITCSKTNGTAFTTLATATVPVSVANGGNGTSTAPSIGQLPIAQSATSYAPQTLSGDASVTSTGVVTVLKTNGSAFTALATASLPLSIANGGRGASTAPTAGQLDVAQSASAFAPVTLSGDCTITSAGAITCSKTNGTAFTALATATVPVSVANGGNGTSTAPSAGQLPIAQSATSYAPQTLSGDASVTNAGVVTVSKTSGTAFGALATLNVGTGLVSSTGNLNLNITGGGCTPGNFVSSITGAGIATCATPSAGAPATNPAGGQNNYAPINMPVLTTASSGPTLTLNGGSFLPVMYLGSSTQPWGAVESTVAGAADLSGGAHYNGSAFIADATSAEILRLTTNGFNFFQNASLTAGVSFGPTLVGTLDSTGINLPTGATYKINGVALSGGLTSIVAGTGLTGGTITTSGGTIALATPVSIANGGSGSTTAPSIGQLEVASSATAFTPVTMSGDATLTSAGVITVTKLNNVSPGALYALNVGSGLASATGNLNLALSGGGCTGGQFVQTISATGAATCASPPAGGNSYPSGSPPQFGGFSAVNTAEAETLSGDATLTRAGANSYSIAVTKTGGTSFSALATASIPLSVANGGEGTSTAPSAGQFRVAASATSVPPVTMSGDCLLSSTGAITCTKTNGAAFGTLATAATPLAISNGGTGNTTAPTAGQLLIATSASAYAPATMSGDATINSTGVITVAKVSGQAGPFAVQTNVVGGQNNYAAINNPAFTGAILNVTGTISDSSGILDLRDSTNTQDSVFLSNASGIRHWALQETIGASGALAQIVIKNMFNTLTPFNIQTNAYDNEVSINSGGLQISVNGATTSGRLVLYGKTSGYEAIRVPDVTPGGDLVLPATAGANGSPLVTDGSGNTSWGGSITLTDTTNSAVYFGSKTSPVGALTANGGNIDMVDGAYWNGAWTATAATASIIVTSGNTVAFYGNSGLTAGSSYSPTVQGSVNPTGFNFQNSGHIGCTGGVPTASSGALNGCDGWGYIGGVTTPVTLTFSHAFSNNVMCNVNGAGQAALWYVANQSTSSIQFVCVQPSTGAACTGTINVTYHCFSTGAP